MGTYFLYNSILIIAVSFAYLAEHEKTAKGRLFSRVVVFIALFIPSALRYNTGTDYFSYVNIFENLNSYSQSIEKGFYVLNVLIKKLGLETQWVFVFSALLIYFPISFFTGRDNFFCLIFVYLTIGFYFKSYNTLRQYISVSFVISAIFFFRRNHSFLALIDLLLAFAFHFSSILLIPFIVLYPLKYKNNILPIFLMIAGVVVLMAFNVFQMILDILSVLGFQYARYASSSFYTSKVQLGTGLGMLIKIFPCILTVFVTKRLVSKSEGKSFSVTANMIFLFSYILAAQFIILGRVRDFFVFIPLLYWGDTLNIKNKYSKIFRIGYFFLLVILFEHDIRIQTRDVFSNSIYPYISIFEKYN